MAIEVVGPRGARWRVRRTWIELRRPRWRGPDASDLGDVPTPDLGGGDDLGIVGVVLAVVAIVVLAVLIVIVGIPLLIFGVELVAVLVVAVAGLLGRLLLRRPWRVVASTSGAPSVQRDVAGWRASRQAMRDLAAELRDGRVGEVVAGTASPAVTALPGVPGAEVARRDAVGLRAWGALALSLVWLGGIGSVVALVLAVRVLRTPARTPTSSTVAVLATVLAVAGVLLTALVVVGLLGEPGTLG